MISYLKFDNKIVLLAVTIKGSYLEAAIGYFDRNLTQESVIVRNEAESFTVKIPGEAKNLKGRAKKFRAKLEIV